MRYLPYRNQFLTEVYSLSTDCWRRIDVAPSCYFAGTRPAIVNGAAYWIGLKKTEGGFDFLLLRFELCDEVFEEAMLPDDAKCSYPCTPVWGKLLFGFFRFEGSEGCEIWTMDCGKMGSWTKQFTVNSRGIVGKLLRLGRSGEQLKVNLMNDLVSYNFETQRANDLGINANYLTFCAYSYVESLIQLDVGKSLFPLDDNGNQQCELACRKSKGDAAIYKEQLKKQHGF
ncbi:uncharacterized protein LOC132295825 [Cornus florida]|uniref:uncharacterized protein LOC132295825 n=1 Tax=Cornus florida TaxID=4283 RepID=UPI00289D05F0|nr:uncharacterized protein LOC132295825 [Cornus florida]